MDVLLSYWCPILSSFILSTSTSRLHPKDPFLQHRLKSASKRASSHKPRCQKHHTPAILISQSDNDILTTSKPPRSTFLIVPPSSYQIYTEPYSSTPLTQKHLLFSYTTFDIPPHYPRPYLHKHPSPPAPRQYTRIRIHVRGSSAKSCIHNSARLSLRGKN